MTVAIDPKLIEKALAVSGERTKEAVVEKALQEFVARREQKRLLEIVGKLDWDPENDYKNERSRREKHRRLGLAPETDD